MNEQTNLNLLKQMLTLLGGILATYGVMSHAQVTEATQDISVLVPALISFGSIVWSVYSHFRMKKVPEAATAIILPKSEPKPAVGTTLNLTPLTGTAKVVG